MYSTVANLLRGMEILSFVRMPRYYWILAHN